MTPDEITAQLDQKLQASANKWPSRNLLGMWAILQMTDSDVPVLHENDLNELCTLVLEVKKEIKELKARSD